jgi:hypothetical protein
VRKRSGYPGYIRDLDNFFRLAKMSAQTANPSGTAHTVATVSHIHSLLAGPLVGLGEQAAWAAISGLLHSKAGVRLLAKGLRIPLGNKAAQAAYGAEVLKFAIENGMRSVAPAMADERRNKSGPVLATQ